MLETYILLCYNIKVDKICILSTFINKKFYSFLYFRKEFFIIFLPYCFFIYSVNTISIGILNSLLLIIPFSLLYDKWIIFNNIILYFFILIAFFSSHIFSLVIIFKNSFILSIHFVLQLQDIYSYFNTKRYNTRIISFSCPKKIFFLYESI